MSLSWRLSMFFLAALATVLLGFSATLFLLGRSYLADRLDDRLEKALDTLEASVDVETDGLEWEPQDRRILLGMVPDIDEVRWVVQDGKGQLVDQSLNVQGTEFPPRNSMRKMPDIPGDTTVIGKAPGWRLARRHLRLQELLRLGKGHPEDDGSDDEVEYQELILIVGLSPAPNEAILQWLALTLALVSASFWLICAALGHWLSRRALIPVVRMATAAREMAAVDVPGGLPSPGTGDELEDLGHAFNELLARRHEALERQQRFAGDASHQLRTPLAGLLSLIEVIRRRKRPDVEYEQTLDQVHREATRLRQIVESLLFLARTETEAARPEGEPIDLRIWLPMQLQQWSEHPRAADIVYHEPDHAAWVRAHPALLGQALENVLDNALKYSEPGTKVTVACEPNSSESILTVTDQGCGLEPQEIGSIFEPFYRAPRSRQLGRSGVGLGLSIVERIVRAWGGTIDVTSSPGRGTRFAIHLPTIRPPAAHAIETTTVAPQPAVRSDRSD